MTGGHEAGDVCDVGHQKGTDFIGNRVRCKVVKNKVAAPFRQAEFDILFTGDQHGINVQGDILDLAVEYEVVKKAGAFYSYGDLRLGQGRIPSTQHLRENPALSAEIEALVRTAAGLTEATDDDKKQSEQAPAEVEEEAATLPIDV